MDKFSSYIYNNDLELRKEVSTSNLNIKIKKQPSKSPDLNVLYFGNLKSIQSLKKMKVINYLFNSVKESYENLECNRLEEIFLMWKLVMFSIIEGD